MPHKTSPILKTLTSKVVISLSFSIQIVYFQNKFKMDELLLNLKSYHNTYIFSN
jgi:hypothetical protein